MHGVILFFATLCVSTYNVSPFVECMVYNYPYNIHNVLYLIIYDPITMLHWWPQEGIIAATYCITSRLLHQKLPV